MTRFLRCIDNFLRYGIWTACKHAWRQLIAFPALRHCLQCGATREELLCAGAP
mgnify:CR=1 FL=1